VDLVVADVAIAIIMGFTQAMAAVVVM